MKTARQLAVLCAALAVLVAAAPAEARSYPRPPRQLAVAVQQMFPRFAWETAYCLSYHESGYNRWRRVAGSSWSRTGDHAWRSWLKARRRYETQWEFHLRLKPIKASVRMAYSISRGGRNWRPWTGTYGRGLCRGL